MIQKIKYCCSMCHEEYDSPSACEEHEKSGHRMIAEIAGIDPTDWNSACGTGTLTPQDLYVRFSDGMCGRYELASIEQELPNYVVPVNMKEG